MSIQASIDMQFVQEYSPKELTLKLVYSGWKADFGDNAFYLPPSDIDDYDWQSIDYKEFDILQFINEHGEKNKIGITLVTNEDIGGEFLIYPERLSLSLSINRRILLSDQQLPDFNWYLIKLRGFISDIEISNIQCDITY